MCSQPVLVTGFAPYGGRDRNPSLECALSLDGTAISGARIVGRGLPVSFSSLGAIVAKLFNEVKPRLVIGLGLCPGESVIRLERAALNIADCEIADNDGFTARAAEVASDGPAARLATLPVHAMEAALLDAGIPARVSSAAGTFLCNACLYLMLGEAQRLEPRPLCGFIHIPYLPEQVSHLLQDVKRGAQIPSDRRSDLASMPLTMAVRAVEIVIHTVINSNSEYRE